MKEMTLKEQVGKYGREILSFLFNFSWNSLSFVSKTRSFSIVVVCVYTEGTVSLGSPFHFYIVSLICVCLSPSLSRFLYLSLSLAPSVFLTVSLSSFFCHLCLTTTFSFHFVVQIFDVKYLGYILGLLNPNKLYLYLNLV